jgi:hypothetical protein
MCLISTESTPSVQSLTQLDIIQKVSAEWRQLGHHFGMSVTGLDNIEKKAQFDNLSCCERVFDHWINCDGTPDYPLSWDSVYNVLCAIGYRGIANDMIKLLATE